MQRREAAGNAKHVAQESKKARRDGIPGSIATDLPKSNVNDGPPLQPEVAAPTPPVAPTKKGEPEQSEAPATGEEASLAPQFHDDPSFSEEDSSVHNLHADFFYGEDDDYNPRHPDEDLDKDGKVLEDDLMDPEEDWKDLLEVTQEQELPGPPPLYEELVKEEAEDAHPLPPNYIPLAANKFNEHEKVLMRIYDVCEKARAPRYLMDAILDIIREEHSKFDTKHGIWRRKAFVKKMMEDFPCPPPTMVGVNLETDLVRDIQYRRTPRNHV